MVRPVGTVRSVLVSRKTCPKQGWEGGPEAWLEIDRPFAAGLDGIEVGADILVLTWLHRARRDLLEVHPRGDPTRPLRGVFSTRASDRPNPIGLHRVKVLARRGATRVQVRPLEALDGTPILDLKPVLSRPAEW